MLQVIFLLLLWALVSGTQAALVSQTVDVPLPREERAETAARRLLPLDLAVERQLWQRGEPPIAVAVWFRGDHRRAAPFVEARARQIVQRNPWLLGKIRCSGDLFGGIHPVLEYSTEVPADGTADSSLSYLQHVSPEKSTVSRFTTPVERFYKQARKSFAVLQPNKGPLWRIAIVPCREHPDEYFALIVSLSHVVGDGHVFINLMSMLCNSASDEEEKVDHHVVRALDLNPVAHSDAIARHALGREAFDFQNNSLAMMAKGVVGILHKWLFREKGQELWFLVDDNAVDAMKRAAALDSSVPSSENDNNSSSSSSSSSISKEGGGKSAVAVSTNDVLASWFFRNSGCSVGLMCVDYRGKLKGHSHRLGRNYWGTLVFHQKPDDFDHPTKIHQSIKTFQCSSSGSGSNAGGGAAAALPTVWEFVTKGSIAVATSWTQRRGTWSLPGCREEVRIPLFDFASYCPSGFAVMRAFTIAEGRTAVYLAGDAQMMAGLRNAPFRSEEMLL